MRVLRKLQELEFGMLDRGATPEAAVLTVFKRGLDYYDSCWPNDEGGFRDMLLGMQERKLARIMKEKRRRGLDEITQLGQEMQG